MTDAHAYSASTSGTSPSRPLRARLRDTVPTWLHPADLQGLAQLGTQATLGVTGVAEAVQGSLYKIAARPFGRHGQRWVDLAPGGTGVRAGGVTGLVYGGIRTATRLVGGTVNAGLARVGPLLGERSSSPPREAMLSAVNGVLGDHLRETANPLAIDMVLRKEGAALALTRDALAAAYPQAGGRLLLMVHGLCMNDLQWQGANDDGLHDHGRVLARELGYTPLYLRYNTGLPMADNGAQLSALLAQVVRAWPQPVTEIALLTHSMGGLVARSACRQAEAAGQPGDWRALLRHLVFLGTPHEGAPLEMVGSWVDAALESNWVTRPFARIGRLRSAGITDLRRGAVTASAAPEAADVPDGDAALPLAAAAPLPAGVACYVVAGALGVAPSAGPLAATRLMMANQMLGDGLVPVASALGESADPARALGFDEGHRFMAWQTGHIGLLYSAAVAAQLRHWLGRTAA